MSGLNPNIIMNLIPNGWEVIALKYVVDYNKDTLSEDTAPCFEFDYVDIGSVTYGKGIEQFQRMVFREAPSRARRKVKTNDVILSTVRTYLKAVASIPERDVQVVVSTGFLAMSAKKKVVPRFLFYAVQSDYFVDTIEANSYGISYPAINSSTAVSCKILLPPLEEQQAIASYLDDRCSKLDEIIIEAEKSIEEYKELKQAVITESVIRGLNDNVLLKDSTDEWIGTIPNNYSRCRLADVSKRIIVGLATSTTPYYRDEGIIMLRNLNIKEGWLDDSDLMYLDSEFANKQEGKFIKAGDVLTVHTGSNLGLSCVVPDKYNHTLSFTTLITTPDTNLILPEFLSYTLNSKLGKREIERLKVGDIKANLNVRQFKYFTIILPPMNEQKKIVEFLNCKVRDIDVLISEKQSLIEDLKAYKKSLIYEVVTGKRRVV